MAAKNKEDSLTIEDNLKAALVPEAEQPYPVPEKWVWTRVEMAFDEVKEKTIPTQETDSAFIGLEHLQSGGGVVTKGDSHDVKSTKTLFREGDILYGKLRPYLNKHALVDFAGIASTDILVFRSKGILDPRLLDRYLGLHHVVTYAQSSSKGINLPRVSPHAMNRLPVPLPPLPEQQRIVEKLESLLGKIKEAKALLDEIPEILQNFRRSVLATACCGELTRDWRTDVRGFSKWKKIDVQSIASVGTGSTPLRSNPNFYADQGTPWITSAATGQPVVDYVSEFVTDAAISAHRLKKYPAGTLLVAMYGEGKTRGQVSELAIEATINQACAAVVVHESLASAAYVKIALQANYLEMRELAEGGNQPNLNLSKIKEFEIRLPPRDEQREIARRVESLFDKADEIEARYKEALELIESLPEIILSKAFRGELVPQDPNDEPASELLNRIRDDGRNEMLKTPRKRVRT